MNLLEEIEMLLPGIGMLLQLKDPANEAEEENEANINLLHTLLY
jgi:hypothetical protein